MSLQTYSREYLQSIPEERKQKMIDTIVSGFIHILKEAAGTGFTSYRCNLLVDEKGCLRNLLNPHQNRILVGSHHPPPPVLTNDDLIAGFQDRFPGCKVFYEEVWVATGPSTQNLKKSIVIDWS